MTTRWRRWGEAGGGRKERLERLKSEGGVAVASAAGGGDVHDTR